ncbi:ribulose-phosphate 3-epimerase [Mycoplasma sp. 3341]|uniref:ribulose-phosphate 3-epimerase n=1 Tax=Mycoplasma sp. 3341 TaxID=3447506 RepID=UPI003F65D41E
MHKHTISPSILDVPKDKQVEYVKQLIDWGIEYVHYDVMDNKFVPNIALSTEIIKEISQKCPKHIMDIHLMVEDVESYIEQFNSFADVITFHVEAVDTQRLRKIYQKYFADKKVGLGLAVKPKTDIFSIDPEILKNVKRILIMSVEPGFGGQKLMPETLAKAKEFSKYIKENNLDIEIQMDGGINGSTIENVFSSGVKLAVVGSYLVKNFSKQTIDKLIG